MKLIEIGEKRRNLTIEFMPHEQDVLFTVMKYVGGHGINSNRRVAVELYDILFEENAQCVSHTLDTNYDNNGLKFKDDE